MSIGLRTILTNDKFNVERVEHKHQDGMVGNVTSAPASTMMVCPQDGVVTGAILSVTMGADAANPLSVSVQATNTRTGSTLFATVPSIAKSAGNVFATTAGGAKTGIVLVKLQNTAVKKGDPIKVVWTLTRTETIDPAVAPSVEIADAAFLLTMAENQDFDPAL